MSSKTLNSLAAIQERADQALSTAAIPDNKLEDWRYVDCKVLQQTFSAAVDDSHAEAAAAFQNCQQYILTNGKPVQQDLVQGWSHNESANIQWLEALTESNSPYQLACASSSSTHVNLNISGTATSPQVLLLRSSGGSYAMNINIECAAGSVADLIIVHDHSDDSRCQYALHVNLAADAVLRIDEIELRANRAQIFHHKYCELAKAAQLSWFQMGYGNGLNRHYWQAELHDVEAHCSLGSACMATQDLQAHHVIKVIHHSPRTSSSQLFKSIAVDNARYSFNGLVRMDKGADESSANQQNANLQLSDKARVHSRPQLDIHTDDVIATHGSATGQADPDELYYLRTRGLDKDQAEQLIISGFLQEVTGQFHAPGSRAWAAQEISTRLLD